MDNLEEKDKFLERYNHPRLNQEEIEVTKTVIKQYGTGIKTEI